ncbi:hypothetical protein DFH06DRAFT_1132137 [Mycena polygramma]|nr:hypothetical protein DFH06DRAFT_1132137 [Mycena polygramma]
MTTWSGEIVAPPGRNGAKQAQTALHERHTARRRKGEKGSVGNVYTRRDKRRDKRREKNASTSKRRSRGCLSARAKASLRELSAHYAPVYASHTGDLFRLAGSTVGPDGMTWSTWHEGGRRCPRGLAYLPGTGIGDGQSPITSISWSFSVAIPQVPCTRCERSLRDRTRPEAPGPYKEHCSLWYRGARDWGRAGKSSDRPVRPVSLARATLARVTRATRGALKFDEIDNFGSLSNSLFMPATPTLLEGGFYKVSYDLPLDNAYAVLPVLKGPTIREPALLQSRPSTNLERTNSAFLTVITPKTASGETPADGPQPQPENVDEIQSDSDGNETPTDETQPEPQPDCDRIDLPLGQPRGRPALIFEEDELQRVDPDEYRRQHPSQRATTLQHCGITSTSFSVVSYVWHSNAAPDLEMQAPEGWREPIGMRSRIPVLLFMVWPQEDVITIWLHTPESRWEAATLGDEFSREFKRVEEGSGARNGEVDPEGELFEIRTDEEEERSSRILDKSETIMGKGRLSMKLSSIATEPRLPQTENTAVAGEVLSTGSSRTVRRRRARYSQVRAAPSTSTSIQQAVAFRRGERGTRYGCPSFGPTRSLDSLCSFELDHRLRGLAAFHRRRLVADQVFCMAFREVKLPTEQHLPTEQRPAWIPQFQSNQRQSNQRHTGNAHVDFSVAKMADTVITWIFLRTDEADGERRSRIWRPLQIFDATKGFARRRGKRVAGGALGEAKRSSAIPVRSGSGALAMRVSLVAPHRSPSLRRTKRSILRSTARRDDTKSRRAHTRSRPSPSEAIRRQAAVAVPRRDLVIRGEFSSCPADLAGSCGFLRWEGVESMHFPGAIYRELMFLGANLTAPLDSPRSTGANGTTMSCAVTLFYARTTDNQTRWPRTYSQTVHYYLAMTEYWNIPPRSLCEEEESAVRGLYGLLPPVSDDKHILLLLKIRVRNARTRRATTSACWEDHALQQKVFAERVALAAVAGPAKDGFGESEGYRSCRSGLGAHRGQCRRRDMDDRYPARPAALLPPMRRATAKCDVRDAVSRGQVFAVGKRKQHKAPVFKKRATAKHNSRPGLTPRQRQRNESAHSVMHPRRLHGGPSAGSQHLVDGQAMDFSDDGESIGCEIRSFSPIADDDVGMDSVVEGEATAGNMSLDLDDAHLGFTIRSFSASTADISEEEVGFGAELSFQHYDSHHGQPSQDEDDDEEESVGPEIAGFSPPLANQCNSRMSSDDGEAREPVEVGKCLCASIGSAMEFGSEISWAQQDQHIQDEADHETHQPPAPLVDQYDAGINSDDDEDEASIGSELTDFGDMEDDGRWPNRPESMQQIEQPGSETSFNCDESDGVSIGSEIDLGSEISQPHHDHFEEDGDNRGSLRSEIRSFSPIADDDVGMDSVAEGEATAGNMSLDLDDAHLGFTIRSFSASTADISEEEVGFGAELSFQHYDSHHGQPSQDEDDGEEESVGPEIAGFSPPLAALEADQVMVDLRDEIVATSISHNVSAGTALVDYRSSDNEHEASSPQGQPLALRSPQHHYVDALPSNDDPHVPHWQPCFPAPPEQGAPQSISSMRTSTLSQRSVRQRHRPPSPYRRPGLSPPNGVTPRQRPVRERPPQQGQASPQDHPVPPPFSGAPLCQSPVQEGSPSQVPPPHRPIPLPQNGATLCQRPVPQRHRQESPYRRPLPSPPNDPPPRQRPIQERPPPHGPPSAHHWPVPPFPNGSAPRQQPPHHVPPHQRPVPPPRPQPVQDHSNQQVSPHRRPVPPPSSRQQSAHEHPPQHVPPHQRPVPPPRQQPVPDHSNQQVPPHRRPVPPPSSRQQPAHERPPQHVPPHQRPVPPPRQQPVPDHSNQQVPPHRRPVPPPSSRQQPAHERPQHVPPHQRPVPPPRQQPVPDNSAQPDEQRPSPTTPKRRKGRAWKRLNIGLPGRKPRSQKLEIASAVRELLDDLKESGALPDQVQQFERQQFPSYGPRAGALEYDTVGDMGSIWNKRLVAVTLELCSTHPLLSVVDGLDVRRALQTNLRHRRSLFIRRALNRDLDPALAEQKRIALNRYNRVYHRHQSRLSGLSFYAHEPSVEQNFKLMEEMDPAIHSEDESCGGGQFIARHPAWRSRAPVVKDFFQVPDVLSFASHFRKVGCEGRLPGQLPAIRTHLAATSDLADSRIPVGLPQNMYDEQWLRRYKEEEPLLYGALKIQPPIDLRTIKFSGPVMQLVEQTRHSEIGAQRMVGKIHKCYHEEKAVDQATQFSTNPANMRTSRKIRQWGISVPGDSSDAGRMTAGGTWTANAPWNTAMRRLSNLRPRAPESRFQREQLVHPVPRSPIVLRGGRGSSPYYCGVPRWSPTNLATGCANLPILDVGGREQLVLGTTLCSLSQCFTVRSRKEGAARTLEQVPRSPQ